MSKYDQAGFNNLVVDNKIIGIKPKEFKLASGQKSRWYVNWRISDTFLIEKVADYILDFSDEKGLNPDCFYGVPEGPTKIATIANLKLAQRSANYGLGSHVIPMGRGKPKEHGDPANRYFIGKPEKRTVVIEDVTTTAGSLVKELEKLLEAGVNVVAAVGLTNRMEKRPDDGLSVMEYIPKRFDGRILYHSMSFSTELLPLAFKKMKTPPDLVKLVQKEFDEKGVKPLKLN